jgi:hypothetical protein
VMEIVDAPFWNSGARSGEKCTCRAPGRSESLRKTTDYPTLTLTLGSTGLRPEKARAQPVYGEWLRRRGRRTRTAARRIR